MDLNFLFQIQPVIRLPTDGLIKLIICYLLSVNQRAKLTRVWGKQRWKVSTPDCVKSVNISLLLNVWPIR